MFKVIPDVFIRVVLMVIVSWLPPHTDLNEISDPGGLRVADPVIQIAF